MNSAGSTRGAERNLFDFIDHGKGRYYSRSEASSAKRRSIDSARSWATDRARLLPNLSDKEG
jgi:hypothetical protein